MECRQADEWITMGVDGELDPEIEQALTLHMEECVRCRNAYKIERRMKTLVATKTACTPAPPHLAQRIRDALPAPPPPITWKERLTHIVEMYPRRAVTAVAAMLVVTAISVFGYTSRSQPAPLMVEELVWHHLNCPVEIETDQPEAVKAWLEERVDFPVDAPRLKPEPFKLIGAHLCSAMHEDAAYIVYSQTQTLPISLCIFKGMNLDLSRLSCVQFNNAPFYTAAYNGQNLVLWSDGNRVYAYIGPMQQNELLAMASSMRQ